jgi:NDP-sugar pyrophosphorylase family protein
MQTTKFDYLVIVASGLSTRMQQYTLNNYLPKSLVSLGNETILDAQLKDAHELANKVVIICRNEHSAMYEDICRLKKYQNVQLIEYSLADGTFNTIQYALKMLSEFCNLTDNQSAGSYSGTRAGTYHLKE